jgi:rRNA methylases
MTPERLRRIRSVLDQRQPDLTVITDEVHKGRNISAIVRTCDAVGVDTIHCVMPEFGYQTYSGAAASADKWVQQKHYSTVSEPICQLKNVGFQVIAANLCEQSVDFRQIDYTKPTALLLGAEVNGVSAYARGEVDHNIVVPMVGMVESFNVSVASAVILMEAHRQRTEAGLYDMPRLEQGLYDDRFMHWAHPKITAYCKQHNLEYPKLRDDGELENPPAWYANARRIIATREKSDR